MALDPTFVGRRGGRGRITIERSATAAFARAVRDTKPVYVDPRAAEAEGYDGLPVPPTYLIAAAHWGLFPEDQPDDPGDDPVVAVLRELLRQGGLLLHGEQAFEIHRPLRVGDVLDVEIEVTDSYEKGNMTFAVGVTTFTDATDGELVATATSNYINRA